MKNAILNILWIMCFTGLFAFPVSGNERKSDGSRFTVPGSSIRISGGLYNAPAIGSASRSRRGGVRFADRWLQINIQFSFRFPDSKSRTLSFINRPSVELYMCNFRPGRRWFCGVQHIHSILLDNQYKSKKYNVSLFLPPNYAYAYLPRDKSDKLDVRSLEGVVVIRDGQGRIMGRKAFSLRKGLTNRAAANLLRQVETMRRGGRVPRFFWPREKTPWAWVDSENYELPAVDLSGGQADKNGSREE